MVINWEGKFFFAVLVCQTYGSAEPIYAAEHGDSCAQPAQKQCKQQTEGAIAFMKVNRYEPTNDPARPLYNPIEARISNTDPDQASPADDAKAAVVLLFVGVFKQVSSKKEG